MIAKGFAINGSKTILVDINEDGLLQTKEGSSNAAKSVGVNAEVHT